MLSLLGVSQVFCRLLFGDSMQVCRGLCPSPQNRAPVRFPVARYDWGNGRHRRGRPCGMSRPVPRKSTESPEEREGTEPLPYRAFLL